MSDSEATLAQHSLARVRVRVRGTVQGVGFRPFVYRLANELGLAGYVRNDALGVLLEVEGATELITRFVQQLHSNAPPLARIDSIEVNGTAVKGEHGFAITQSGPGAAATLITPDAATCSACLAELYNPDDRRLGYPFINCTDCGPRFTIAQGTPYDRARTTMSRFVMCAACRAEYEDPASRRFHAQPNACWECGPQLTLVDSRGSVLPGGDAHSAIASAARMLAEGAIIALKGVGGYHLACRADLQSAAARLRERKHRQEKPFALMVPNLEWAQRVAEVPAEAVELLSGPERPIILLPRRRDARVADAVAPGAHELGIMLPYSPVHHLLLSRTNAPLVMTSGNVSDEPIAYDDNDALERLSRVADAFLWHNRPIHIRTDDSVTRVSVNQKPTLLRRSRGYVPAPLELPIAAPPLLACGAEQNNTFCVALDRQAWIGHHIGDLENYETLHSFRTGIDHFLRVFRIRPEVIVHDLHPDYLSTKDALARFDLPAIGVQHHHAHLAACLAEHGRTEPALGVIYDGTGLGTDGTIWGGEFLLGDLRGFERVGHLRATQLPGGAAAIREPWRMACAWLQECSGASPGIPSSLHERVKASDWAAVRQLLRMGLNAPTTTSMGRLFDAVSALCGLRTRISYEGQAAIELERAADRCETGRYDIEVGQSGTMIELDPRAMLNQIVNELGSGVQVSTIARRFHNAVAEGTVRACVLIAGERGVQTVVLSGGVFQNLLLLNGVASGVHAAGLEVLTPTRVPANDGGISFGQAAVAAARTS